MKQLAFSIGTEIPHLFCELAEVLKEARSDSLISIIFLYVATVLLGGLSVTGILFFYSQILSPLLRMSSSVSRYKAFSTFGSHFCVFSLFYRRGIGICLSPAMTLSPQSGTVAFVMYTMVTPTLNPFIYSLRNKGKNGALGNLSRAASGPSWITNLRKKWMLWPLREVWVSFCNWVML